MLNEDETALEEIHDLLVPSSSPSPQEQNDYWSMSNVAHLIRFHVNPRSELIVATSDNCPIPLECLDILLKHKLHKTFTICVGLMIIGLSMPCSIVAQLI